MHCGICPGLLDDPGRDIHTPLPRHSADNAYNPLHYLGWYSTLRLWKHQYLTCSKPRGKQDASVIFSQVILADRLGFFTAAAAPEVTPTGAQQHPSRASPGFGGMGDESSTFADADMLADGIANSSLTEQSPDLSSTDSSVCGLLPPAQWRVFWVVLPPRAPACDGTLLCLRLPCGTPPCRPAQCR